MSKAGRAYLVCFISGHHPTLDVGSTLPAEPMPPTDQLSVREVSSDDLWLKCPTLMLNGAIISLLPVSMNSPITLTQR